MATQEERLQVLRMIEEGQVTAEEGARLLEALNAASEEGPKEGGRDRRPRQMRVRVTDLDTGKQQVDINLPVSLVKVGAKMGARFAPGMIAMDDVREALKAGRAGKVMDVVDEEKRERVEIFVD